MYSLNHKENHTMHCLETIDRLNERAVQMPQRSSTAVGYSGHGARTGGLQAHSIGDEYPYIIMGVADRLEAPTEYQVMDSRTGNRSKRHPTYMAAYIECMSLRVRNLMHS